ncbi:MAG: hypothetical protein R3246_09330 [Acidimicrobiia bacterium]|nr:hypothetical protein [Acidimicrobiia bacterium]
MRRGPVVLAVLVAACFGSGDSSTTTPADPAAGTYQEAFDTWSAALAAGDHDTAATVTEPSQISLLALAEGLSGAQVAGLTTADRNAVASNFWSGFVDQLGSGPDLPGLQVGEWTETTAGSRTFAIGALSRTSDSAALEVVFVEIDGRWSIDLLATFPSALVNLVPDAAQVIRATGDSRLLEEMRSWRSSVELVVERSGSDPRLNQAGLAALESIVR